MKNMLIIRRTKIRSIFILCGALAAYCVAFFANASELDSSHNEHRQHTDSYKQIRQWVLAIKNCR